MKEIDRKLIEMAVAAGRANQNKITNFLHFHETIPTYENALYILALMSTRKREQIQEAKQLLEKLLAYQDASGNFPVYLHDYPFYYKRKQGIKLLAPLYWIHHKFHSVIGNDLEEKLEKSLTRLIRYAESYEGDYLTSLRVGCAMQAMGRGNTIVEELRELGPQFPWFTRHGIAEMLTSLQMIYPKISDSPWKSFWKHLQQTWNPKLKNYSGPLFDEIQEGPDLAPSLYDLYIASFSTILPKRCQPLLEASLIQPSEESWNPTPSLKEKGEIDGLQWVQYHDEKMQYSLIEQKEKNESKGFHPLSIRWESEETPCSLVCQGGQFNRLQYNTDPQEMELRYVFSDVETIDHPFENRELLLYCTANPHCKVTVEGVPATTFRLGDKVVIHSELNMELTFTLEEGSADVVGHIMPGNRPSQVGDSREDWQIFLRAIRKHSPCTICLHIKRK